jgi:hypothetical protein
MRGVGQWMGDAVADLEQAKARTIGVLDWVVGSWPVVCHPELEGIWESFTDVN